MDHRRGAAWSHTSGVFWRAGQLTTGMVLGRSLLLSALLINLNLLDVECAVTLFPCFSPSFRLPGWSDGPTPVFRSNAPCKVAHTALLLLSKSAPFCYRARPSWYRGARTYFPALLTFPIHTLLNDIIRRGVLMVTSVELLRSKMKRAWYCRYTRYGTQYMLRTIIRARPSEV